MADSFDVNKNDDGINISVSDHGLGFDSESSNCKYNMMLDSFIKTHENTILTDSKLHFTSYVFFI